MTAALNVLALLLALPNPAETHSHSLGVRYNKQGADAHENSGVGVSLNARALT